MIGETMESDSWFPCYPSDLIGDTAHLSTHDFGAYWRLLCWYYLKGPPENDDDLLRNVMHVERADWIRTKGRVMSFFTLNGDGHWHQKRADEIIQERDELMARRRAQTAAARAANPKHQFVTNTVSNVVTNEVTNGVTTVQPQPQPQLKGGSPVSDRISHEKELDRVEKRLKEVQGQGIPLPEGGAKYTTPQKAEMSVLKQRREELKKALHYVA